MMTRSWSVWSLVFLMALSLGCSMVLPRPSATPSPEATLPSTPSVLESEISGTPKPEPTPEPSEFTLTLSNASPYPICEVYITPPEAENWGENELADASIAPGATWRFDLEDELVDVEIWTCDGAVLETFWNVEANAAITAGRSDLEPLRLINSLGTDICSVYIANVESAEWGQNWLPEYEVLEMDSTRLFFLPWGLYDAMVEDCDGNIVAQVTLPVQPGGLTWEAGAQMTPGDAWIYVYNRSDYEICGVYFGPPESEFGPNLVGNEALVRFSDMLWAVEVGLEHPWVVYIEDCDGIRLEYNTFYPGDWVVIGGEGLTALEVFNYTSAVICEIYISPSTDDSWGENWLTEYEVIAPEGGKRAFFIEPGTYDLLAVDCEGNMLAQYDKGEIGPEGAYWKLNP